MEAPKTVIDVLGRQVDCTPLHNIDLAGAWIDYDRRLDTYLVFLDGKPVPTVSHPLGKGLYVMLDLEMTRVVGVMIEGFQRHFVPRYVWPARIKHALWDLWGSTPSQPVTPQAIIAERICQPV